ncbi:hypothetical protein GIB67_012051 [Kingdonia uniflora]|uniref:Uncharacterized protein n=1 Tax=Kingdonia uniflora TaxID=39325 RepID=A0A7J7M057_9MAGN|nr:hypothetical protein GIB67_012051 [Kingdonia uniflora]
MYVKGKLKLLAFDSFTTEGSDESNGKNKYEGLDPRITTFLFSISKLIRKKKINNVDCFILRGNLERATLGTISNNHADVLSHYIEGYFSQRIGHREHIRDAQIIKLKDEVSLKIYWETKSESYIQEYRSVDGIRVLGLDLRAKELEIGHHFSSEIFREVILELAARKEVVRQIAKEEIKEEDVRIVGGKLIRCVKDNDRIPGPVCRSNVKNICVESNLVLRLVIEMETLIDTKMLTSCHTVKSNNVESGRGDEVVLVQYPDFSGKYVSYPPNSDVFREFCKSRDLVGRIWGNVVEHADSQFRGCTVASGEEHFFLLPDLEKGKSDRGVEESISLEYYDGNAQGNLEEGFMCYLCQLEYGLSLPLGNLAKGIMYTIGTCPAQLNRNMKEVINVCKSLNRLWEENKVESRISPEDVLQYYGVKNYSATDGAYLCSSSSRLLFFNLNSAGWMWNDNVIWVKVDCLQR